MLYYVLMLSSLVLCLCNLLTCKCIISGSVYRLVNDYTSKLVKNYQLQTASFVRTIVLVREGTLELPNRASL